MSSQYLYFWIDDRGRIVELRVTRRGEDTDGSSGGRYGRSMTRDLSGSYLRLDDLPSAYADPVREHVRRTGESQGIVKVDVEVEAGRETAPRGGAPPGSSRDRTEQRDRTDQEDLR